MKNNKNKSAVWRTALAALLGMALFFACNGEGGQGNSEDGRRFGKFEGLDAGTEKQILQDYFDAYVNGENGLTVNDLRVNGYYGTYNGLIAVSIEGPWVEPPFISFFPGFKPDDEFKHTRTWGFLFTLTGEIEPGGPEHGGLVTFCYPNSINLLFYINKDRSFYTQHDNPYDRYNIEDFLSYEDLKYIADSVNSTDIFGRFAGLYEGLDAETEMRIIQDHLDKYRPPIYTYSVYESYVGYYFGTFNGCVVLTIYAHPNPWDERQHKFTIDGIDFEYPEGTTNPSLLLPIVWKDGQIYDGREHYGYRDSGLALREAYDIGLLTHDDLKEINNRIRAAYEVYYKWGGNE